MVHFHLKNWGRTLHGGDVLFDNHLRRTQMGGSLGWRLLSSGGCEVPLNGIRIRILVV